MDDPPFRLSDYGVEARLQRLTESQARALEDVLQALDPPGTDAGLALFLLPLAEWGFTSGQMRKLAEALPRDFPRDHREIYFDFRLHRWMRLLEPPTLAECLDEYVRTAPSRSEGMDYVKREWAAFLTRWERSAGGDRP